MAGEVSITVVGNLTRDPEVRQAGQANVTAFAVAANERKFNRESNQWEDGATQFFECSAWRQLGEHVARSLTKGMEVILQGNLRQRTYEKDGQTRNRVEIDVQAIGPNLGRQLAQVQKSAPNGQGQQQAVQAQPQYGPPQQPSYPQPGAPQPGYVQPGYTTQGQQAAPYAGPPAQQGGFPPQPSQYQPQPYVGDDTPF